MSYPVPPNSSSGDDSAHNHGAGNNPPQDGGVHESPFPTAAQHIVQPQQNVYRTAEGHYGYAAPQRSGSTSPESYFHAAPAGNTLAWTSTAALISSIFNVLITLIPFVNFFIAPFTGLIALVFTIVAFVTISDGKNDKKSFAVIATGLLLLSVFTFIMSYVFLAILDSSFSW